MSQAIQSNSHMTMMREPVFLNKAAELTPVIRRRKTCPLNAIRLCEDPQAVHGWSMEPIDTADAYLQKSFSTGDSLILDFGTHGVGWLTFACDYTGSPPDAPAHLRFTFGETLCEIAEPFSEYEGWLSSSWLQQHDEYIDVIPSTIQL